MYYEENQNGDKNLKCTIELYTLAAQQGNAQAQYNLAILYEKGEGVDKDLERAIKLYTLAADQNYSPAQHNLNICRNTIIAQDKEKESEKPMTACSKLKLEDLNYQSIPSWEDIDEMDRRKRKAVERQRREERARQDAEKAKKQAHLEKQQDLCFSKEQKMLGEKENIMENIRKMSHSEQIQLAQALYPKGQPQDEETVLSALKKLGLETSVVKNGTQVKLPLGETTVLHHPHKGKRSNDNVPLAFLGKVKSSLAAIEIYEATILGFRTNRPTLTG